MNAPDHAQAPTRSERSQRRPFSSWREHHGWSAGASLRRLASKPLGSLLTIAVMGLALALPLAFYLLLSNVQSLGDALGRNQVINVFLKPDQVAGNAQILARQVQQHDGVASVTLKTPAQGMEELSKMQGFSDSLRVLDDNPLPFVLQVQPRDGLSAEAAAQLVDDLRGMQGVDVVQDSGSWRQRLDALLGVGDRAVVILAGLFALAVLLVVGNTVRVDITSRAEEIGVLKLIGASRAFVRRPYLYAGIWYGLFSGILAVGLALLIELALVGPVQRLSQVYEGKLQVGGLPPWLLLAVPVTAALLGWLGARLVSAWQLRRAA
ncbi:MAG TPA: permease-like cell division protein FtsX [Dyella sp.]|uniref:permease-like cell division protein FtsX n=1 Tax=Dyella sp. TaxID=1869338 RepID=UPI002C2B3296|nr:permease-like cell division protein FtsX [Dyella sp.]HTV84550.1 permease-like cell division protein FtsX [Dyella sp.]